MSIASGFREKWQAVADAADLTIGERDDARYSAMAKAAMAAGHQLVAVAVIDAYQKEIRRLIEKLRQYEPVN